MENAQDSTVGYEIGRPRSTWAGENMRTIKIPVEQGQLRKIDDPDGAGKRFTYYAFARVLDLPSNIPLDVNPRKQNLHTKVARDIAGTLKSDPENFYLYNRGLTTLCYDAYYDHKSRSLVLCFPDVDSNGEPHDDDSESEDYELSQYVGNKDFGLVDGGHTYMVLLDALSKAKARGLESLHEIRNAYVRIEVIVGVDDDLALKLADARNNSMQVKQFSLANLANQFKWVKSRFADTGFGDFAVYAENDTPVEEKRTGDKRRLDIRDIVRVATAVHPNWLSGDSHPMIAYTGAGNALKMYVAEETGYEKEEEKIKEQGGLGEPTPLGFRKLRQILPDVLELYWEIKGTFEETYREIGGETGVKRRAEAGGEIEPATGRARGKAGKYEHFSPRNLREYLGNHDPGLTPPEAFVIPILSAFRAILHDNAQTGQLEWKVDPIQLYRKFKHKYVATIIESVGDVKKPNAVGKSKNVWSLLYLSVGKDAESFSSANMN